MSKVTADYSGPEKNELYNDENVFETFDDLDDDVFTDEEEQEVQSTTSSDGQSDIDEEEEEDEEKAQKKAVKAAKDKKEAAKKAKGQKGDDIEALADEDSEEEEEEKDDEEEEGEDSEAKKKEEEEEEEEEEKPEQKQEDKKPKGKPTYVTVDGETYALDSNAEVQVQVDGKNQKVPLQELKNHYSGKVAWDKKFNEINLKEQTFKREAETIKEKEKYLTGLAEQVKGVLADQTKNPKDAFKIFLEAVGVDAYDVMERQFKADLTELANVLNMEPADRKNYFLERKNSHLLEQQKKRDERLKEAERVTSYRQKADALRKSYGVSEAQYVDALEELKSFGEEEKDISEKQIVEWAATKPHREQVSTLLKPYKDQFDEDAYGELSWKLANILRAGQDTPDNIKKHLADVYGVPTKVKELSKKLNPLGRKAKTPAKPTSRKFSYESFDDIDDE